VIVSSPAPAALHVPAVSLPTSLTSNGPALDSKDPNASKTIPFKNVFDSLALFDDLENDTGPQKQSASVPSSTTKKELPEDSSTGTEDALVLQTPPVVQTASPSLPAPALILAQSAHGAVPENDQTPEDATGTPQTTSGDQSDETAPVTLSSQPLYSPLPYSLVLSKARLDVPSTNSTAPARGATSTNAAETVTTPDPTKAQVTARSFETQAKSVSMPQLVTAEAQAPATKPDTALQASSIPIPASAPIPPRVALVQGRTSTKVDLPFKTATAPIRASVPTAQPATSSAMSLASDNPVHAHVTAPQTATVTAVAPVSVKAQVDNSDPIASSLPVKSLTPVSTSSPVRTSSPLRTSSPVRTTPNVRTSAPVRTSPDINNSSPASNSPSVSNSSPISNPPDAAAPTPLPKPTQFPSLANDQAASPQPTALPDQIATPAPVPQPAASNASPTIAADATPRSSSIPPSMVSSAEDKPEPTLAPTAAAASTSPLAPSTSPLAAPAMAHDVPARTPEIPSSVSMPQHPALAVTAAPKTPLLPQAENFAFAVRMLGLESSPHSSVTQSTAPLSTNETPLTQPKSPVTQPQSSDSQPPAPLRSQPSSDPRADAQPSTPEPEKPSDAVQNPSDPLVARPAPPETLGVTSHWNDSAVWQAPELGSAAAPPEPTEGARANLPLAAQETHLLAPELPKSSGTSEILLHLTDNDQSSAAIRVADRAGSVNVSVHASDPVLRESLRSNLGELSTQLNDQGWKADVIKSAATATQSGSQQDSHEGGQRGSPQQQSFSGDRQSQRDRRANGGQWQQELDQQTTGGDAHSGGNA
jgi:hypothetical protein